MKEQRVFGNVWVIYSLDDSKWYLERRQPGNWAVSQLFDTQEDAQKAYSNHKVKWEGYNE